MNPTPTTHQPDIPCIDEHKTLECVCLNCGQNGDAICPHCKSEYSPESPIEDYGFKPSTPQQMLAKFAIFARSVIEKKNARFHLECFLIASGDASADGVSMKALGAKWKVTRAMVSKRCIEICALLGMPPSQYMRKEQARVSYRNSNRRNRKL